ncbi:hypothetical protein EV175_004988, partial [Coemansia sp. RSA 1933]
AHSPESFKNGLQRLPCAREGYLYGAGIGFGVSIIRLVKGGNLISAGNWGVIAFAISAVASKGMCNYQRAHYHAKVHTLLEKQLGSTPLHVEGFKNPKQPSDDDSKSNPPS